MDRTRKPNLPLTPEQQRLAADNRALVGWALNRWAWDVSPQEHEDISARLVDGLIRAAQLYDPCYRVAGKRVRFTTYASYWLWQSVQTWRRDRDKRRDIGGVSLDDQCGHENGSLSDQQAAPAELDRLDELANRETVEAWRAALPLHLWRAVWLRIGIGLSLGEVASQEGVTKTTIQNRVSRALQLIRRVEGVP